MKSWKNYILALSLVLFLCVPSLVIADTGTIQNDEIRVAYATDKGTFRYWYAGKDYKQTLQFVNIREYTSDGRSLHCFYFDEAKVDTFVLTESTQSLQYEFDDFEGSRRYHILLYLELEFNQIQIDLTIIRWDFEVPDSQLRLTYVNNGVTNDLLLDDSHYLYMQVTVQKVDLSRDWYNIEFWNLAINVSNSILLIIIALLTILTLTLALNGKRKGRKCKR